MSESSIGPLMRPATPRVPHAQRRRRPARGGARAASSTRPRRGPPAARQARPRPDRRRHPPRPHRRAAEAARVPGPRPQGRADRRRLHRARRRSERALDDAAGRSRGEEIDANARDLPGAGVHRSCATIPSCSRCAATREWLDMPMEELFRLARDDDRRPDPRARRLRQALRRRPRADLDPRAALSADAGLRLGGGQGRRRARRHRPEVQPAARRATSSAPTAQPEQVVLTMPMLPGTRRRARRCPSRWATTSASPSRPRRCTARRCRCPTRRWRRGSTLLGVRAARQARARADAKHALARAIVERFHGAEAPPRPRQRTSSAVFVAARRPRGRSRRPSSPSRRRPVHLPALIAEAFGGSRSEARRLLAQGGVKLDGEALGADDARRGRRAPGRARCCRSASGGSGACGVPAEGFVRAVAILARGIQRERRSAMLPNSSQRRPRPRDKIPGSGARRPDGQALYCSVRSPGLTPGARRQEGIPFPGGATVFENSTACAHSSRRPRGARPGVDKLSTCAWARRTEMKPVMSGATVYG